MPFEHLGAFCPPGLPAGIGGEGVAGGGLVHLSARLDLHVLLGRFRGKIYVEHAEHF